MTLTSPDNTRLTTKQLSFRLPVHIAAKIAALCEMYPQKNRTQIVADLLTTALDALEEVLPEALGEPVEQPLSDERAISPDEPVPRALSPWWTKRALHEACQQALLRT